MKDNKITYGGVGVVTILGIVFLILKLCGLIDWSWWLVTLPFIFEGVLLVVVIILTIIIALINNGDDF